jgi:hypothetical protein
MACTSTVTRASLARSNTGGKGRGEEVAKREGEGRE